LPRRKSSGTEGQAEDLQMVFRETHWEELTRQGYTVVSGAIDDRTLCAAQDAANALNAMHPDGGWERSRNEGWREIRWCRDECLMALVAKVLDPLMLEILETAPPMDFVQLASTLPGFTTGVRVGRHFHIDGGKDASLGVFNVLLGVALTPVASSTAGGFHLLPGSHDKVAAAFGSQPEEPPPHWGNLKLECERQLLPEAQLAVPSLLPGDIVVAHSFIAHGTSRNTSDVRRDMIFQRRAAAPLWDPATQEKARQTFMRDPWKFFRRPGLH
jgi:hypothetical protein